LQKNAATPVSTQALADTGMTMANVTAMPVSV